MTPYGDNRGDAGVDAYELGPSHIDVRFKTGRVYRYTSESAGEENIEQMARLAREGEGLTTFINRNVKHDFVRRLR